MKTKKIRVLLTSILLIALACSNANEKPNGGLSLDCLVVSFKESYLENIPKADIFFIKGAALEVHKEYGRRIKLVEDLKGNFPKNTATFTAWGNGAAFIELNRFDDLRQYNNQDTLLMLLAPVEDLTADMPEGNTFFEKPGDYATLTCAPSVLKWSNGYVSGYIYPQKEGEALSMSTITWEELQALLNFTKKDALQ